ncbi:hypothetical protein BJ986_002459 [Phycicoccus badiiscoriae]|uniref:Uncharacterized protein n=1 Tax=Pedococcus badiiscoriae TaxID=642776 RepID=A0A852WRY4_9MICO|nr:hypothetical protein [Pedococcus badiiscoriae]NYG07972.1 hypothetical protein [Pedococcus badiiscoriae]
MPSRAQGKSRAAKDAQFADLREPVYLLAPEARGTSGKAVVWRPLGYLTLTVVWVVLAVASLALAVLVLPWRLTGDGAGPMGTSPGFAGSPLRGVVVGLIIGPVIGAVSATFLCVSIGSALSSATYLGRSLLPAYRREKLSFTTFSQGAEATGPASMFGFRTAFSLIPVRLTRWTKIATLIAAQGQVVNVRLWVLGFWWGIFYVFTVGWMLWPAQGAASVVCTAVSVLLFAVLAYFVWRNRRNYPTIMPAAYRGTPYERSWPNRPVAQKLGAQNGTVKKPAKRASRSSSPSP